MLERLSETNFNEASYKSISCSSKINQQPADCQVSSLINCTYTHIHTFNGIGDVNLLDWRAHTLRT